LFGSEDTGKPGCVTRGSEEIVSVGAIIAIIVVVLIIAVVAAVASRMVRRSAERRSLGPEYSRLADEVGTRKANAEYDKRRRRVDGLGVKPLSQERRILYSDQWVAAQETFIDNPAESVRTAAGLVTAVAADRGYEVANSDQLLTDLSVYYGNQLDGYRVALTATSKAGNTATEELRQALLDYRAMFRELAEITDDDETTGTTAAAGTAVTPVAPATTATTDTPAVVEETPAVVEETPAVVDETPAEAEETPADETADETGHRVFWRRDSRAASAVNGSQP
jgi:hypothetical protein